MLISQTNKILLMQWSIFNRDTVDSTNSTRIQSYPTTRAPLIIWQPLSNKDKHTLSHPWLRVGSSEVKHWAVRRGYCRSDLIPWSEEGKQKGVSGLFAYQTCPAVCVPVVFIWAHTAQAAGAKKKKRSLISWQHIRQVFDIDLTPLRRPEWEAAVADTSSRPA